MKSSLDNFGLISKSYLSHRHRLFYSKILWTPVSTGVTTFYENINSYFLGFRRAALIFAT